MSKLGRGYQGTVASGKIIVGDSIRISPTYEKAKVTKIYIGYKQVAQAYKHESITLYLDKEVNIFRGSVVEKNSEIRICRDFYAEILWIDNSSLVPESNYFFKVRTNMTSGVIEKIDKDELKRNQIRTCKISLSQEIPMSLHESEDSLGKITILDRLTFNTMGAGTISQTEFDSNDDNNQSHPFSKKIQISNAKTLWFTGLSGFG